MQVHASTCKCSKPKATAKYAAYVDAKKKINAIRTARGFYPVVALTGGQFSAGANPVAARGPTPPKGRSKSSKGKKGKGKPTNFSNPPKGNGTIKQRGQDFFKNIVCLRCGGNGHYAASCPLHLRARSALMTLMKAWWLWPCPS